MDAVLDQYLKRNHRVLRHCACCGYNAELDCHDPRTVVIHGDYVHSYFVPTDRCS